MDIEKLKKEYNTQNTGFTAYPIYVMVQELVCIGVLDCEYSVCCPYGGGYEQVEYAHEEDAELHFASEKELEVFLSENEGAYHKDEFEEFKMGYIWHPVEFFLTIKGAEEYIKLNSHNHGKLRTYVGQFDRKNTEMRGLLKHLGFKTES